jgi:hypothetical protein
VTAALIEAASAAAAAAEELGRQTERHIDPYFPPPLAAFPQPLQDFDRAVSSTSSCLRYTAGLAAGIIGPGPEHPALAHVPGKLAVASTRASWATDSCIWPARRTIGRELQRAGTDPDPDPTEHARSAAVAWHRASTLEEALRAAKPEDTGLAALMAVTLHQSVILECLARASDRYRDGVLEACERLPRATAARSTRASSPFRRAADTLRRASKVTASAHGALLDEYKRAALFLARPVKGTP